VEIKRNKERKEYIKALRGGSVKVGEKQVIQ
jgi:hypothetical protein